MTSNLINFSAYSAPGNRVSTPEGGVVVKWTACFYFITTSVSSMTETYSFSLISRQCNVLYEGALYEQVKNMEPITPLPDNPLPAPPRQGTLHHIAISLTHLPTEQ